MAAVISDHISPFDVHFDISSMGICALRSTSIPFVLLLLRLYDLKAVDKHQNVSML